MKTHIFNIQASIVTCFIISILATSCSKSLLNSTTENIVDTTKIGKIKTVVILGNSIVWHPPQTDIGWSGNWGMAASVKDSDFVHILIHNLHQKDTSVAIAFKNISDFEKNFDSYSFSNLDSFKNPDMLLMKIGENVDDEKAANDNFIYYYNSLLNYLDPNKNAVKILVDGFWYNSKVNEDIMKYAISKNYPYISIDNLSTDLTNEAGNKFSNPQVSIHPSDKGMRLIAESIWNYMKAYF